MWYLEVAIKQEKQCLIPANNGVIWKKRCVNNYIQWQRWQVNDDDDTEWNENIQHEIQIKHNCAEIERGNNSKE